MKKILFLIHDLSVGGAEKVLVNLANNLDKAKYDITVMSLFDVGVNKQFLKSEVHYKFCFKRMIRGNSKYMLLLSPRQLYKWLIKDHYDIAIAYLEGPCARIISGCDDKDTKLISWIHIEQHTKKRGAASFRSYQEAKSCYEKFDRIIGVSDSVKKDFQSIFPISVPMEVLYNTNETAKIIALSKEVPKELPKVHDEIRLVGMGKILKSKGFDRLARIHVKLREKGWNVHTYILGVGPEQENIETYLKENHAEDSYTFLGYQTNPYQFLSKCDVFVCASFAEGFSTAATEALILGVPVVTTLVAGMKEMLGENNEYGIVTENTEEALYAGIEEMLKPENRKHYQKQAQTRGKDFKTETTVQAVENMFDRL